MLCTSSVIVDDGIGRRRSERADEAPFASFVSEVSEDSWSSALAYPSSDEEAESAPRQTLPLPSDAEEDLLDVEEAADEAIATATSVAFRLRPAAALSVKTAQLVIAEPVDAPFEEEEDFFGDDVLSFSISDSLPAELLIAIFNKLDPHSFASLRCVCTYWRDLADSKWCWLKRSKVYWEQILYLTERSMEVAKNIFNCQLRQQFERRVQFLLDTLNDVERHAQQRVKWHSHFPTTGYFEAAGALRHQLQTTLDITTNILNKNACLTVNFDMLDLSLRRYFVQVASMFPIVVPPTPAELKERRRVEKRRKMRDQLQRQNNDNMLRGYQLAMGHQSPAGLGDDEDGEAEEEGEEDELRAYIMVDPTQLQQSLCKKVVQMSRQGRASSLAFPNRSQSDSVGQRRSLRTSSGGSLTTEASPARTKVDAMRRRGSAARSKGLLRRSSRSFDENFCREDDENMSAIIEASPVLPPQAAASSSASPSSASAASTSAATSNANKKMKSKSSVAASRSTSEDNCLLAYPRSSASSKKGKKKVQKNETSGHTTGNLTADAPSLVIQDRKAREVWERLVGASVHSVDYHWFYKNVVLEVFPRASDHEVFERYFTFFVNFPRDDRVTVFKWDVIISQFGPMDQFFDNFLKFGCGNGFMGAINSVKAEEELSGRVGRYLLRFSRKEPEKLTLSYCLISSSRRRAQVYHRRKPRNASLASFLDTYLHPRDTPISPIGKSLNLSSAQFLDFDSFVQSKGCYVATSLS